MYIHQQIYCQKQHIHSQQGPENVPQCNSPFNLILISIRKLQVKLLASNIMLENDSANTSIPRHIFFGLTALLFVTMCVSEWVFLKISSSAGTVEHLAGRAHCGVCNGGFGSTCGEDRVMLESSTASTVTLTLLFTYNCMQCLYGVHTEEDIYLRQRACKGGGGTAKRDKDRKSVV